VLAGSNVLISVHYFNFVDGFTLKELSVYPSTSSTIVKPLVLCGLLHYEKVIHFLFLSLNCFWLLICLKFRSLITTS